MVKKSGGKPQQQPQQRSKKPADAIILLLKQEVLEGVLSGKQTLLLRPQPYRAGKYWIGRMGKIHAEIKLGEPMKIDARTWDDLHEKHRSNFKAMPHKNVYGLPVVVVRRVSCEYKVDGDPSKRKRRLV